MFFSIEYQRGVFFSKNVRGLCFYFNRTSGSSVFFSIEYQGTVFISKSVSELCFFKYNVRDLRSFQKASGSCVFINRTSESGVLFSRTSGNCVLFNSFLQYNVSGLGSFFKTCPRKISPVRLLHSCTVRVK